MFETGGNKIRVNIFGSEYVLKADNNQDFIQSIARYLDGKMNELDKSLSLNSKVKIAILAALNITEELFEERQYRERLLSQINEESAKINRSIEEVLE